MKKSFVQSMIAHSLLILLMVFGPMLLGGKGNAEQQGQDGDGKYSQRKEGVILPKPTEIELVEVDGEGKQKKQAAKKKVEHKCEYWYGGVGLEHHWDGTVTNAPEGYPAYEAGIRVGDEILSGISDMRGEPGTPITVLIRRDGVTMMFTFNRGKICYNDI